MLFALALLHSPLTLFNQLEKMNQYRKRSSYAWFNDGVFHFALQKT
jgi:hypothetical protein